MPPKKKAKDATKVKELKPSMKKDVKKKTLKEKKDLETSDDELVSESGSDMNLYEPPTKRSKVAEEEQAEISTLSVNEIVENIQALACSLNLNDKMLIENLNLDQKDELVKELICLKDLKAGLKVELTSLISRVQGCPIELNRKNSLAMKENESINSKNNLANCFDVVVTPAGELRSEIVSERLQDCKVVELKFGNGIDSPVLPTVNESNSMLKGILKKSNAAKFTEKLLKDVEEEIPE